jgi:hypothetical protein
MLLAACPPRPASPPADGKTVRDALLKERVTRRRVKPAPAPDRCPSTLPLPGRAVRNTIAPWSGYYQGGEVHSAPSGLFAPRRVTR